MKRIDYDTMYSITCISLHGDAYIMQAGWDYAKQKRSFFYSVRDSCCKHDGGTNYAKGNSIPLL